MRRRIPRSHPGALWALALATACMLAPWARAQENQEQRLLASRYADQAAEALNAGAWAKAEELLRRQLVLQPGNFVVLYNLACTRALQDDPKGAADLLVQAVEHGFSDLRYMDRDPQLKAARDEPAYKAIRANWPEVLRRQCENNLADARTLFKKGYDESRDQRLRVAYLSAFNPKSFESAKAELSRIADWANTHLFTTLLDQTQAAQDAWVVVVLPSKPDFTRWATMSYGSGAVQGTSMIAGAYEHDRKRLVAMDLGATMRHEFLHALHWRHATRLGQMHPVWILEGLGTLVEDYDLDQAGRLVPATSWRTNTVKRIEKLGKLTPIETLAAMKTAQFSSQRPLANYAQARAVFLYLSQKDQLAPWYAYYTTHYLEDPKGVKALEAVLGKPIEEINKDFRAWVRALPAVPEEIKPGMASLGVEVDAGNGEGPVIASIPRLPGGGVSPLKLGDVLTAIDDKPVRDIAELVRVLSGYKPGDRVEVAYRRGKLLGEAPVVLVKR
jgi:hypothetical protein